MVNILWIDRGFTTISTPTCLLFTVNDDFTSNTGTLRFRTGDSESCIEISITDDANLESNELFSIDFSFSLPPNTPVVPSISAVVTIVDNDVGMY